MDDESKKEENQGASTSKKEEEDFERREHEFRSYTGSTASEFSARSRVDGKRDSQRRQARMAEARAPRRRPVRRGRVAKRRRYQPVRRAALHTAATRRRPRRDRRADRDASVSTIFTKSSTHAPTDSRSCVYCGHRCCGRRYGYGTKKKWRKAYIRRIRELMKKDKNLDERKLKRSLNTAKAKRHRSSNASDQEKSDIVYKTEGIQVGSRSTLLSHLLVSTNVTLSDEEPPKTEQEHNQYCDITPEMIYGTLHSLRTWKHASSADDIMHYMQTHYPVNTNLAELKAELTKKLEAAVIAEILCVTTKDNVQYYKLSCRLQQRGLRKNHVTMFWKVYSDTMSPVKKKKTPPPQPLNPLPAPTSQNYDPYT